MRHYQKAILSILLSGGILAIQCQQAPMARAQTKALNKAWNLHNAGNFKQALPYALKAKRQARKRYSFRHPRHLDSLYVLSQVYDGLGRYAEAIPLLEKWLEIMEKKLGQNNLDLGQARGKLSTLYKHQERFAEAERLIRKNMKINERKFGRNHISWAISLAFLGSLNMDQRLYTKAEPFYEKALALAEKKRGKNHPEIARYLKFLASSYKFQRRFDEAVSLYKRSLAIYERKFGKNHPKVSEALMELGIFYWSWLKRDDDAEALFKRALKIYERKYGRHDNQVAYALGYLGNIYLNQDRYAKAEPLFERCLAISENKLGKHHRIVAVDLLNLSSVYHGQGRYNDAERLLKRARAIREKASGKNSPEVAFTLNRLALVYVEQGRYAVAEQLHNNAFKIQKNTFGEEKRETADSFHYLAKLYGKQNRLVEAYKHAARATQIYQSTTQNAASQKSAGYMSRTHQLRPLVKGALFNMNSFGLRLANQAPEQLEKLANETFQATQNALSGATSRALTQMSVRLGTGDPNLARLVRDQQDLASRWQVLDKRLINALGKPANKRNQRTEKKLRQKFVSINARIRALKVHIAKDFPQYAELSNPRPLRIEQVQKLLGPSEVLVYYFAQKEATYVWAITREAVAWKKIDRTREHLERQITILRKSLDPTTKANSGKGKRGFKQLKNEQDFDLALTHQLYQTLLEPVANVIKGKRHLMVVPSGPLTGLPFHMLVSTPSPYDTNLAKRFKSAHWLIRDHAVTILPSAASLRALRVFAQKTTAERPFIGFGNPDFSKPVKKRRKNKPRRIARSTRNYAAYFQGRLADVDRLSGTIPQLPDTADEIRAIGKVFKARHSEIILGRQASETTIKALSARGVLDDYQIVHFATHGLVAGDIKGLAEPALALSLPAKASEKDDGLLTASEVAQLKLNADWVVLSACNTAAGGKPGAEALSGLARAFFYSGTRALLVSHWPVVSEAAVKLTTGTFDNLKINPDMGRAEALRRTMLTLIDNGVPHEVHPAYWAPFIVVGEGGR